MSLSQALAAAVSVCASCLRAVAIAAGLSPVRRRRVTFARPRSCTAAGDPASSGCRRRGPSRKLADRSFSAVDRLGRELRRPRARFSRLRPRGAGSIPPSSRLQLYGVARASRPADSTSARSACSTRRRSSQQLNGLTTDIQAAAWSSASRCRARPTMRWRDRRRSAALGTAATAVPQPARRARQLPRWNNNQWTSCQREQRHQVSCPPIPVSRWPAATAQLEFDAQGTMTAAAARRHGWPPRRPIVLREAGDG